MAWYDSGNGGWYKPEEARDPMRGIQLGAQLRQQAIQNALQQKNQELDAQRSFLQTQEYFSKKELQNKMMAGTADLAKTMAGFKDPTDPAIPETIYGVMAQNPTIAPLGEQFLDIHRKAVEFKTRQQELAESRRLRERAFQEKEQTNLRRLDILQQQADTGRLRADDMAEWHQLQGDIQQAKQISNENERATVHEEIARRLDLFERNAASREARFNASTQKLSPEKRDLLKRDLDRLDVRAEKGDFAVKKEGGGIFSAKDKYGPKYFEERKKLEEQYGLTGTPETAPTNAPLAAPLQKFKFDPSTGKLVPIQ